MSPTCRPSTSRARFLLDTRAQAARRSRDLLGADRRRCSCSAPGCSATRCSPTSTPTGSCRASSPTSSTSCMPPHRDTWQPTHGGRFTADQDPRPRHRRRHDRRRRHHACCPSGRGGHYPDTPLPGTVGNVGIAGHRTTYGRPFNRLDELEVGDEIWLLTPVGDHRYVVTARPRTATASRRRPVPPASPTPATGASSRPSDDALLTLTTCHPKGSAAQRLVVRASLADSHPPGTPRPAGPRRRGRVTPDPTIESPAVPSRLLRPALATAVLVLVAARLGRLGRRGRPA